MTRILMIIKTSFLKVPSEFKIEIGEYNSVQIQIDDGKVVNLEWVDALTLARALEEVVREARRKATGR